MNTYAVNEQAGTIFIERSLQCSIEMAWRYWTEGELRMKWFCGGVTGEAVGELVVLDFDHRRLSTAGAPEGMDCGEPVKMEGRITKIDKPNCLAFSWPSPPDVEDTHVEINFESVDEGTLVKVFHENLQLDEHLKGCAGGWHAHLDLLQDIASESEARDFWIRYSEVMEEYHRRLA
ncbi:MAG: SRPBCC domain-containing protein [Planctomycetota bacterium]